MKLIMLFVLFVVAIISQSCAMPTADAAPGAAANATADAKDAASKAAKDAAQAADPLSKLAKGGLGSMNPLQMASKFISAVVSACENLLKSIFGFGSSIPGLGEVGKVVGGIEHMGEEMVGDALKMFGGGKSDAKPGADKAAKSADDKPKAPAIDIPGKDIVADVMSVGTGMLGGLFGSFGI